MTRISICSRSQSSFSWLDMSAIFARASSSEETPRFFHLSKKLECKRIALDERVEFELRIRAPLRFVVVIELSVVRSVDGPHLVHCKTRHLDERTRLFLWQLLQPAALAVALRAHRMHKRGRCLQRDPRIAPQHIVPAGKERLRQTVIRCIEPDGVRPCEDIDAFGLRKIARQRQLRVSDLLEASLALDLQVLDGLELRDRIFVGSFGLSSSSRTNWKTRCGVFPSGARM